MSSPYCRAAVGTGVVPRLKVILDSANHLTVVPVETTGSTFRAGIPATLFTTSYATPVPWRPYDMSPDGQRFLMIKEDAGGIGNDHSLDHGHEPDEPGLGAVAQDDNNPDITGSFRTANTTLTFPR